MVASWSLLLTAMAIPYVFAGVAVSLALTRSPFEVNQVYGVDLIGAALGCVGVVLVLNVLDGPSTIILAGAIAATASASSAAARTAGERSVATSRWLRPAPLLATLLACTALNAIAPISIRPLMVKDKVEEPKPGRYEKWNSYSRIIAEPRPF